MRPPAAPRRAERLAELRELPERDTEEARKGLASGRAERAEPPGDRSAAAKDAAHAETPRGAPRAAMDRRSRSARFVLVEVREKIARHGPAPFRLFSGA